MPPTDPMTPQRMSDYTTKYLNELLRGRELVRGQETPPHDLPEVSGREDELRQQWLNAPQEDRDYIESALRPE